MLNISINNSSQTKATIPPLLCVNISIKDNLSFVNDNFEEMIYYCKMLNIHEDILKLNFNGEIRKFEKANN